MSKYELIPQEIVELLNYRISEEEISARLYLGMVEWLEDAGLDGAAKMVQAWSCEEMEHAGWVRTFLRGHDFIPEVQTIVGAKTEYSSLKDVLLQAYEHEVDISKQCNEMLLKVRELRCSYVEPLALKFLDEQNDEIDKTLYWLDRLAVVGTDPAGILLVDQEMAKED